MLKRFQKFLKKEDMGWWLISALIFSIATAFSSIVDHASIEIAGVVLSEQSTALVTAAFVFLVVSSIPIFGYFLSRRSSRKQKSRK